MSGVFSPPLVSDLAADEGGGVWTAAGSWGGVGFEGAFELFTSGVAELAARGVDGDAGFLVGATFAVWDDAVFLAVGLSQPMIREQTAANHRTLDVGKHMSTRGMRSSILILATNTGRK